MPCLFAITPSTENTVKAANMLVSVSNMGIRMAALRKESLIFFKSSKTFTSFHGIRTDSKIQLSLSQNKHKACSRLCGYSYGKNDFLLLSY